jgi:PE-PPE domain
MNAAVNLLVREEPQPAGVTLADKSLRNHSMAGKHRKPSPRRFAALRRWAPSLTAAAVSLTCLSTALTTGTATVAPVTLAALVTPASSTAQIFASSDFYGVDWIGRYGQPQVVPFFLGPQGIVGAIDRNAGDPAGIAVLSSGWGAGQTGTALATMQANNDPAMRNIKMVVLDNNSNRAGGGFWTTYWMFAPLLLTSAEPTPNSLNVPVVDVAYDYNVNSAAPTYPIDLFADANTLVAYIYGYLGQSTAKVPSEALNAKPDDPVHYHYIVAEDGTVIDKIPVSGNITYVTFKSARLPLVLPLLLIPGGNILADAFESTLTALVNWGYKDNKPIPDDPGVTRPVGLLPSASETATAIRQLQASVPQGARGFAAAAQQDVSSPGGLVTGPLSEVTPTAGPATGNSPAPSLTSAPSTTAQSANFVDMTTGNKVSPGSSSTSTASSGRANPLQQLVGSIVWAFGGRAQSLTNGGQTNATTSTTPGSFGSPGSSP